MWSWCFNKVTAHCYLHCPQVCCRGRPHRWLETTPANGSHRHVHGDAASPRLSYSRQSARSFHLYTLESVRTSLSQSLICTVYASLVSLIKVELHCKLVCENWNYLVWLIRIWSEVTKWKHFNVFQRLIKDGLILVQIWDLGLCLEENYFKTHDPQDRTVVSTAVFLLIFLPDGHNVPGVRGAGEAENGPGLGKEAGSVSCVVPVTHNDALLIPWHHQVFIHRGPVHSWDRVLWVVTKQL